ncbi:MAG: hypothetical protein JNG84_06465 [Archangium sp.]|nr:hypothetical protein [Archangium sp.]
MWKRIVVVAACVLAGCPAPVDEAPDSGALPRVDGGARLDAGVTVDGGAADDAGAPGDGGEPPSDGGVDAGLVSDAGAPDSGTADAGSTMDAGAAYDAGSPSDAGTGVDAGSAMDAGTTLDAGPAVDAGTTLDAGADAGSMVNLDALPEGVLAAFASVSREVVREQAADDALNDNRVQFFPNTAASITLFRWRILNSDTQAELWRSSVKQPTYDFGANTRGEYDVELTVSNGAVKSRFFHRRLISVVLPRTANGRRQFTLDVTGNITVSPVTVVPLVSGGSSTIQPGDVVRLTATSNQGGSVTFVGLGDATQAPIHVLSPASGPLTLSRTGSMLTLLNCQNVIIDGLGHGAGATPMPDAAYGLFLQNTSMTGAQALFARADFGQNNVAPRCQGPFEIYGVRIDNAAGTGVELRTTAVLGTYNSTPFQVDSTTCSVPRFRLHHTFMQRTGQEGFYVGYTHDGVNGDGQFAYPIRDAKVYRNRIQNTGRDGLQVCNSRPNLEVHDNSVNGSGGNGESAHLSAMQFNAGNSGFVYNNHLIGGTGLFIDVGCSGGDSSFFNNVVEPDPSLTSSHSVYVRAGGVQGVDYALFHNSLIAERSFAVRLDMGRSPTYDCVDAGTAGYLDSLVVAHNTGVLAPGANVLNDFCGCASSASLCAPVLREASNVARLPTTSADFCFADAGQHDFEPVCSTTPAFTPAPAESLNDAGIPASRLPVPVWFDMTGRVSPTPPMYRGAHSQPRP